MVGTQPTPDGGVVGSAITYGVAGTSTDAQVKATRFFGARPRQRTPQSPLFPPIHSKLAVGGPDLAIYGPRGAPTIPRYNFSAQLGVSLAPPGCDGLQASSRSCRRSPPSVGGRSTPRSTSAVHRLVHRCAIFWNRSRVQPYSRSRVTVGREGISRVPGGRSLHGETGVSQLACPLRLRIAGVRPFPQAAAMPHAIPHA